MMGSRFYAVVAILLGAMGWMAVTSVRDESQTWDEAIHLSAGYSYWKTGDYRLNPEHPPLGKLWNAIPLLFGDVPLPLGHPSWQKNQEFEFGLQFLYNGPYPAGDLLFQARMMTVAIMLLFGLSLAIWVRAKFSAEVAIAVLVFYCFDPTIIAHGRYVTSDLLIAFTSFLAAISWLWWLERGRWWRLGIAGVALGLAMAGKYSWPFLLPVFILIALLQRIPLKRIAEGLIVVVMFGAVVVAITYAPLSSKLIPATQRYRKAHPQTILLSKAIEGTYESKTTLGRIAMAVAPRLGIQDHPYLLGILKHASHSRMGHHAYLFGQVSESGWWYYFPAALAVKMPVGQILALILAIVIWVRHRIFSPAGFQLAALFTVLYLSIAMFAGINIGVRHLLPILPFLFVVMAVTLAGRSWRVALAVCLLLSAAETIWRHPYHLSFINLLAGGPDQGYKYLADSNIDWGQDFRRLRTWKDTNLGDDHLCVASFGGGSMEYFGLSGSPVPHSDDLPGRQDVDCMAAVSVTLLAGDYVGRDTYAWLRELTPVARIGHSIHIYDLRARNRRARIPKE